MRTIKFRGKRIVNGDWIYGDLFREIAFTPTGRKKKSEYNGFWAIQTETPDGIKSYSVDPETVGQFTGVLDGRNQEIFENDIVATYFDGHCTYQGEVRFEAGRFIVSTNNGLLTNIGGKSWLVIGNIHDNPELMEGGEK